MQLFKDGTFVTGIEYRDDLGNPVNGSVIISDTSEDALAISEGATFKIKGDKVEVDPTKKRPIHEEEERKRNKKAKADVMVLDVQNRLRNKKRKDLDIQDLRDIVLAIAVQVGLVDTDDLKKDEAEEPPTKK